jgi:HPt (histidine-containing phosphotransfer) domain-containing protein
MIPTKNLLSLFFIILLSTNTAPSHAAVFDATAFKGGGDELVLSTTWSFVPEVWLDEKSLDPYATRGDAVKFPVPGGIKEAMLTAGKEAKVSYWGTAYIVLKNLNLPRGDLGLRIRADSAYHIYWGKISATGRWSQVMGAGTPGKSAAESIPAVADGLGRLPYDGPGNYLLMVHLSGFHYSDTNIWKAPVLADYARSERTYMLQLIMTLFVGGMIFILAIYYLSLYFQRREDRASLWLAAFTSLVFLRYFSTSSELLALSLFKSSVLLYEVIRKLEFGLLGVTAVCGLLYVIETFGYHRLRRHVYIVAVPAAAWAAFCLFTRAPLYQPWLLYANLYLIATIGANIALTIHAVAKGKKGSILLLLGILLFGMSLVNDVLIGLSILRNSLFLIPFGLTALLLMQGQVIAALFAVAFRTAQRLSLHLQAEVKKQTQEIRSMLDNIPQGVLSFVSGSVADSNYSRHLSSILGTPNIAGRTIEELLLTPSTLDADQRDRVRAALFAVLDEDPIAFDLNIHQFPTELELKGNEPQTKILELTWSTVLNENGRIGKVLMTLHDVTKLRQYQEESMKQRKQMEFIQEIVGISATSFSQFILSARGFMAENDRLISSNPSKNNEVVKIVFVNMHTIKGAARTLGFHQMTGALHEVEQIFASMLRSDDIPWDQDLLLADQKRVRDILDTYEHINNDILGRASISDQNVVIDRTVIEEQVAVLHGILSKLESNADQARLQAQAHRLEEIAFSDAEDLFMDLLRGSNKVARDLGKPEPVVVVKGIKVRVNYRLQTLLRNIFTHIIRNSIDHGMETPEERAVQNKKPHGTLEVELAEHREGLLIQYRDDGKGLNLARLKAKGIESGLLSENSEASRQEIAELIFAAGLSTAQGVTQFSGRGVGMDAVRRYVTEIGGEVYLKLEQGLKGSDYQPFTICIVIPRIYYINSGEEMAEPLVADA